MRGLVLGLGLGVLAASAFGQLLDDDVHYYTFVNYNHNLMFLGSAESRKGQGYSFAFGRKDPKVKIYHKYEGELIWEAYYLTTSTTNTSAEFPFAFNHGAGILATARYRREIRPNWNIYYDGCVGAQFIDHPNRDLPLCNNSTFGFGFGTELITSNNGAVILGGRMLHQSNMGRKRPNLGQNLFEWYLGYKFKV